MSTNTPKPKKIYKVIYSSKMKDSIDLRTQIIKLIKLMPLKTGIVKLYLFS